MAKTTAYSQQIGKLVQLEQYELS